MSLSLLALSSVLVASFASAQVVIDRNTVGPAEAPGNRYEEVDNVSCGGSQTVEKTNVHVDMNGSGRGTSVFTRDNCTLILRDCIIEGGVTASDKSNIILERCVVHSESYALWSDGSGDITVVDSTVNASDTSVLIHKHASGNVNLVRTTVNGGKEDVRGSGKILRTKELPKGVVVPKQKEQIPRDGFTYQPQDLACDGGGTKTYSKLHFKKNKLIYAERDCKIVVDGCIIDSDRVGVLALDGDVELRNCQIRGGMTAVKATGSGSVTIIDSTLSSDEEALSSDRWSKGDVTLKRTKILSGRVRALGKGKFVQQP